jgi:Mlc titration factor MtfA (ptsG expression regulator)
MGLLIAATFMFFVFIGITKALRFTAEKVEDAARSNVVISLRYGKDFKENVRMQLTQFSYYNKLSEEGKEKFFDRLLLHYSRENIYGAEGFVADEKIKIMICATLAQLTFGLDKEWLASFDRIELHPTIFKMYAGGPLMKGATTPNGIVRISVKDYLEGYRVGDDKLNVGLHEFGHALFIEFSASAQDFSDMRELVFPYEQEAEKEIAKGFDGEHLLRKYAFTNKHEFFAVSVETFFESPKEFYTEHKELYGIMSKILNQDPRNTTGDYAIIANV